MIGKIEVYMEHNCEYDTLKDPSLKTRIFINILNVTFPGIGDFIEEAPEFALRIIGPFKGRKTAGFRIASAIPEIFRAVIFSLSNIFRKEIKIEGISLKLLAIYTKDRPYVRTFLNPQKPLTSPTVSIAKLKTLTPLKLSSPIVQTLEIASKEYELIFGKQPLNIAPSPLFFKFIHTVHGLKGTIIFPVNSAEHVNFYKFLEISGLGTERLTGYGDITVEFN